MNTKLLTSALIAASALVAGSAFAQDNAPLTRAQVEAQYTQARAQGALAPTGEVGYSSGAAVARANSQLSRDAVHSEYLQAARNGALAQRGEGADIGYVASGPSTANRQAIKAEAAYAVRHGQQGGGEV